MITPCDRSTAVPKSKVNPKKPQETKTKTK